MAVSPWEPKQPPYGKDVRHWPPKACRILSETWPKWITWIARPGRPGDCATTLRKAGGNVELLNLNKRNLELLVITKLATVFDLFTMSRMQ